MISHCGLGIIWEWKSQAVMGSCSPIPYTASLLSPALTESPWPCQGHALLHTAQWPGIASACLVSPRDREGAGYCHALTPSFS